jgi:hypothetical protein
MENRNGLVVDVRPPHGRAEREAALGWWLTFRVISG